MTTIRDVARAARVSVATVSRVFNDSGPVRAGKRHRIVEVGERRRHSPDGAVRTPSRRRTRTRPDLCGDASPVGFDDIPIARYVTPSLTTVRVSIPAQGARAAQRLFEVPGQSGGHERVQELVPGEVVVRNTCAAVSAAGHAAPRPAATIENQEVVP